MLYGGDSTGRRERERERQMTVICSVDQSAITQYHQDKEGRRGGKRRGSEETRGEERRGDANNASISGKETDAKVVSLQSGDILYFSDPQ